MNEEAYENLLKLHSTVVGYIEKGDGQNIEDLIKEAEKDTLKLIGRNRFLNFRNPQTGKTLLEIMVSLGADLMLFESFLPKSQKSGKRQLPKFYCLKKVEETNQYKLEEDEIEYEGSRLKQSLEEQNPWTNEEGCNKLSTLKKELIEIIKAGDIIKIEIELDKIPLWIGRDRFLTLRFFEDDTTILEEILKANIDYKTLEYFFAEIDGNEIEELSKQKKSKLKKIIIKKCYDVKSIQSSTMVEVPSKSKHRFSTLIKVKYTIQESSQNHLEKLIKTIIEQKCSWVGLLILLGLRKSSNITNEESLAVDQSIVISALKDLAEKIGKINFENVKEEQYLYIYYYILIYSFRLSQISRLKKSEQLVENEEKAPSEIIAYVKIMVNTYENFNIDGLQKIVNLFNKTDKENFNSLARGVLNKIFYYLPVNLIAKIAGYYFYFFLLQLARTYKEIKENKAARDFQEDYFQNRLKFLAYLFRELNSRNQPLPFSFPIESINPHQLTGLMNFIAEYISKRDPYLNFPFISKTVTGLEKPAYFMVIFCLFGLKEMLGDQSTINLAKADLERLYKKHPIIICAYVENLLKVIHFPREISKSERQNAGYNALSNENEDISSKKTLTVADLDRIDQQYIDIFDLAVYLIGMLLSLPNRDLQKIDEIYESFCKRLDNYPELLKAVCNSNTFYDKSGMRHEREKGLGRPVEDKLKEREKEEEEKRRSQDEIKRRSEESVRKSQEEILDDSENKVKPKKKSLVKTLRSVYRLSSKLKEGDKENEEADDKKIGLPGGRKGTT